MNTYRVITEQPVTERWTVHAESQDEAIEKVRLLLEEGDDTHVEDITDLGSDREGEIYFQAFDVNRPEPIELTRPVPVQVLKDVLSLFGELNDHNVMDELIEAYMPLYDEVRELLNR